MIIDTHGHYTTYPAAVEAYRGMQIARTANPTKGVINVSDDEIRESIEGGQLRVQRERGTDLTLFSPRASSMGHHFGGPAISRFWTEHNNDLIHRVCQLFPDNFAQIAMLPQSPGVDPSTCADELKRAVLELGAVGCLLNPDPSGGYWQSPPLTDSYWYPLYETLVELDVPAVVHVSASCNPAMHTTGDYYLNTDTTAFMQLFQTPQLFQDFPSLRFVIPHGGGAVAYHWGRFRGMNLDLGRAELSELLMENLWFDTCMYHQPGMNLLFEVIETKNLLFASEMIGAVRGKNPDTGYFFDDTKRYIDAIDLTEAQRTQVFEANALAVYPRLRPLAERHAARASDARAAV